MANIREIKALCKKDEKALEKALECLPENCTECTKRHGGLCVTLMFSEIFDDLDTLEIHMRKLVGLNL